MTLKQLLDVIKNDTVSLYRGRVDDMGFLAVGAGIVFNIYPEFVPESWYNNKVLDVEIVTLYKKMVIKIIVEV